LSWRWSSAQPLCPPTLVSADAVTYDMIGDIYGVFRTRAAATQALRAIAPDFEPTLKHALHLAAALAPLRVRPWPYAGCIGIREHDSARGRSEVHVLDRWCYFGTARSDADLSELLENPRPNVFSLESYKVLARFLKLPPIRCQIFPLARSLVAAA
jgi:DNA polymerase-3 subunit epsilon